MARERSAATEGGGRAQKGARRRTGKQPWRAAVELDLAVDREFGAGFGAGTGLEPEQNIKGNGEGEREKNA